MNQLNELDASFLYLEDERTPLHVGGAFVFKKQSSDSGVCFNFNRFKAILERKLGTQTFFRKRVVESSLNLDLPIWADDDQFDLDNHLSYVTLPSTPSPCTLCELTSTILSQGLDRRRPLWHISYVDGLDKEQDYSEDHFALIIRLHIAAIDPNSGEDILSQLLKVSPEIDELGEPAAWMPEAMPDATSWFDEAYSHALSLPKKLAGLAKDTASSAFHSLLQERLERLNLPRLLMSAPQTSVNQSISTNRAVDKFIISSAQVRHIRQQLNDVTTNDIIMGLCAEALKHYLPSEQTSEQNHSNGKPQSLIALSPISVRSTSLEVKSGNQLSASLFSLATDIPDPITRIREIHKAAQSSSHYDAAISASRLTELIPSCMVALSARVYSEFLLAQKHKPMFNLPITNVPGPQFPLFLEENELIEHLCTGPLFDGIGLGINIVSYNGNFSVTSTYCPELGHPDRSLSDCLEQALATINHRLDNSEPLEQIDGDYAQPKSSGLIEDVVGLVSNLFPFNHKNTKEPADS